MSEFEEKKKQRKVSDNQKTEMLQNISFKKRRGRP